MKKWYKITAILAVTVIVLGMFAMACAPKPAAPVPIGPITIKVGLPTALSGPAAPWGQTSLEPYETWIELFNKEGFEVGGKTYNFKMIQVDDMNSYEGGAAAVKQLVFGDKVRFIAGHWTWNFSAVAAVTNPAKVIFVTRTGAPDQLPASWGGLYDPKTMPYVVFGTPSQEEFTADCFALIKAYPNYKRLGLMDSVQSGVDSAGWRALKKELDAAGIRYHNEWFAVGTSDFTPYITRFAEAGCNLVFVAGWVGEFMLFSKQRWEMGYKDMKVGCSGPFVDINIYKAVCGPDAAQGLIGAYYDNSQFKETKVNPKYIAQCQEALRIAAEKTGKPYTYTGEIAWLPSHVLILVQAMQKAGTVDDTDAIMKAIRGGTFDTTIGKWTMSGEKTYGSAVVFGSPAPLCTIQGDKEVYLSEYPTKPLP